LSNPTDQFKRTGKALKFLRTRLVDDKVGRSVVSHTSV
jgi:hypothetical protein